MLRSSATGPFVWLPPGKILSEETFHQRLPFKWAEESLCAVESEFGWIRDGKVLMCLSSEFLGEPCWLLGSTLGNRAIPSLPWTHLRKLMGKASLWGSTPLQHLFLGGASHSRVSFWT